MSTPACPSFTLLDRADLLIGPILHHSIFAGFGIAPCIAGGFGAVIYLSVKFGVLRRRNPFPYALATGPIVFFLTSAVMTLAIIFKVRIGCSTKPTPRLVSTSPKRSSDDCRS